MAGSPGKILRVNLTKGSSSKEDIPPHFQRQYLGGMGFATRLLLDEVRGVDPLGPENKLIVAPGLLVGSGIARSSKTVFLAKSPLTGAFGRSVAGATMGAALHRVGFELMVVEGVSERPALIRVEEGEVGVEEASDLWGLDVREAQKRLHDRYRDGSTATIGPAGENLSRIAGIDCEERQAGRAGLGAVMGSKRLKAIVVSGAGRLHMAEPERVKELATHWIKVHREHESAKLDVKYGTAEFYDWMNREVGVFPSRNWQQGYFHKSFDRLGKGELSPLDPYYWAPKYMVKNVGCPYCTAPCGRIFEVKSGPYEGTKLDGLEYEVVYALGGNLEIEDPEAVAKLHLLCDLYGLDAISAGLTVSWAMEAFERGLLGTGDLDGLSLKFGDVEATVEALRRMAYREGKVGALLSDGVAEASRRLGKGSEAFAIHSKGLELPAYDVRGLKGVGLAFAVSVRGGDHLTATVYGTELTGRWWKFSGVDRFSAADKGFEVKLHEDLMVLYDLLGLCKFSRHMYYAEALPDLVKAVAGLELSLSDLFTVGEKVYNLQRVFNVREGLTRRDDTLPERVFWEPIPKGRSGGSLIRREEFERMLDDYYTARGWSKDGVPTEAKLVELGLEDLIEVLRTS